MPMVDYLCPVCDLRFEHFLHAPPDEHYCDNEECGGVATRIFSQPGEYRPVNALRFDPIVVWVNNENPDQVSVPGRWNEPVQEGYHAITITDMRAADRMATHMNNVALRDAVNQRAAEKQHWDDITRQRRSDTLARIGSNPRAQAMFRAACAHADKIRNRRYSTTLDPRGHFQALSFDSSNRQSFCDRSTGWKEKKA